MTYKKLKTFADCAKAEGIDPKKLPNVAGLPKEHQQAIVDHYKLIIIVQALNNCDGEKWQPDWNNTNQTKYSCYFRIKATDKQPGGVGFSYSAYGRWCAYTTCGSRLCFKSSELALYAGKQFEKEFKSYFLILKTK